MSTNKSAGTSLFRITSAAGASMLPEGRHIVTIISITADLVKPKADDGWVDDTHQACVMFKNDKGVFKDWYSLDAYARFAELSVKDQNSGKFLKCGAEGYAVIKKTGERLIDEVRREKSQNILAQMIHACGIEKGVEADESDLIGLELGIVVKMNGTLLRAKSFYRKPAKGAVLREE